MAVRMMIGLNHGAAPANEVDNQQTWMWTSRSSYIKHDTPRLCHIPIPAPLIYIVLDPIL
jgi:hypothetical protein